MTRKIRRLSTLAEVIEVCGGTTKFGSQIGRSKQWVSIYKRRGWLPSVTYLKVIGVLKRRGYSAPKTLWNWDKRAA